MKNIHILPTDKPSNGYILGKCIKELSDVKIGQFIKTYYLMFSEEYFQPQNIYITSDEEIKEGVNQWYLDKVLNKPRNSSGSQYGENQNVIILTTDQDLIKDGVQAIDDEFLEWFVKNPSCESVEIERDSREVGGHNGGVAIEYGLYEIIIPKEEPCEHFTPTIGCIKDVCSCNKDPKQAPFKHKVESLSTEEVLANRSDSYEFIDFDKQDTPEEETLAKIKFVLSTNNDAQAIRLLEQYKEWQQEQILDFLYSEITERRDYSASKMCYKVIEFIENIKKK